MKRYYEDLKLTEGQLHALADILDSFIEGRAGRNGGDGGNGMGNSGTYRDCDRVAVALLQKIDSAARRIGNRKRIDEMLRKARTALLKRGAK